jgi:hypothetical protein
VSHSSPDIEGITARSAVIGLLLCLAIGTGAPYANMVIGGSTHVFDFSTAGPLFLFLLLVSVVLRTLLPVLACRGESCVVVYIMMIVASAIPTAGLTEWPLPIITGARWA